MQQGKKTFMEYQLHVPINIDAPLQRTQGLFHLFLGGEQGALPSTAQIIAAI